MIQDNPPVVSETIAIVARLRPMTEAERAALAQYLEQLGQRRS